MAISDVPPISAVSVHGFCGFNFWISCLCRKYGPGSDCGPVWLVSALFCLSAWWLHAEHRLFVCLLSINFINESLGQMANADSTDPDQPAPDCRIIRSGSALFAISLRI